MPLSFLSLQTFVRNGVKNPTEVSVGSYAALNTLPRDDLTRRPLVPTMRLASGSQTFKRRQRRIPIGRRREAIFSGDPNRVLFLDTLAETCEKTDWQIHAWCLMSNHFHLVVETPRANLVDGMQWLLGVYTNRFNHRHKEFGHLFMRSL